MTNPVLVSCVLTLHKALHRSVCRTHQRRYRRRCTTVRNCQPDLGRCLHRLRSTLHNVSMTMTRHDAAVPLQRAGLRRAAEEQPANHQRMVVSGASR